MAGYNESYAQALRDACGVYYDETSQKYFMVEANAWASEELKEQISHIPDSASVEAIKTNYAKQKYGEPGWYCNNPVEQTAHINEFNLKVYKEMTLCVQATDPGYLSTLSVDDRTDLINKYIEWSETHTTQITDENGATTNVFGYTDEEYAALSDTEKANVPKVQTDCMTRWTEANKKDLSTHYGVDISTFATPATEAEQPSSDTPSEEHTDEQSESIPAGTENEGASGSATTTDGKTTSTWGKISATIGAVGAAFIGTVKAIYNDKVEPWLESHGFIKHAQDTVETTEPESTTPETQSENTETITEEQTENTASSDGVGEQKEVPDEIAEIANASEATATDDLEAGVK